MLLQRVAVARRRGDWTAARGEWEACIARSRERVVVVVDRYVRRGWIPDGDREDTVQKALLRAGRALIVNLDKLDEPAFFAGVVRCADFQCRDDARRQVRREQHEKPLDARSSWNDDEDSGGRYDTELGVIATDGWNRDREIREAGAWVDELVAQLPDERDRKLLTLQRLGLTDAAIADELGTSVGNVYQLRTRALKKLRGLIDP